MLEELISIHQEVLANTPHDFNRYLYSRINWSAQGICILGDRGVGKTTLICQDLALRYKTPDRALYLSADYINVTSFGIFKIAKTFFAHGGEALYVDEVHKYPGWSIEIKNILDTYKRQQVIFSASSSLDLNQSKADLSRRVVYHRLGGLSFREYLKLRHGIDSRVLTLEEVFQDHVSIVSSFTKLPILKYFEEYLRRGYYPFFLEGSEDYFSKLYNVIEKVIFEDLAVVYNLKQTTLPILKKILWLVAMSGGLTPNIDKMSKNLGVSREMIYNCLSYLSNSGLLNEIFHSARGNSLVRKPGKIYINNTNLLFAIHGNLRLETETGGIRETFFVNQVSAIHKINLHEKGDYLIDDRWVVEVGGKGKTDKQIRGEAQSYLALDDITAGFGRKVPLYLFGFLY